MVSKMPYGAWLTAIAELDGLRSHLLSLGLVEYHLRTEKAVIKLVQERNPVAAALVLGRIADDPGLHPALSFRLSELKDVLLPYFSVEQEPRGEQA